MLEKLFDNTKGNSYANKFRRKRFKLFLDLIKNITKPVKIIDLGGTVNYWKQMGLTDPSEALITILNIEEENETLPNTTFMKGDVCNPPIDLKNFDLIFSNSVIEHVGSEQKRKQMAHLITSSCKSYYIQTPNYWFPFEPHFLFPFFQYFPRFIRIFFVKYFDMGWFKKTGDKKKAEEIVDSIYLLSLNEFSSLFPSATIHKEKVLFFNKSFTAINTQH